MRLCLVIQLILANIKDGGCRLEGEDGGCRLEGEDGGCKLEVGG
jgi:hypothetical protein